MANHTLMDVQGHRGARSVLPENTLPAFEYALELGVNTLEFDLGVTRDNHVVVIHDQRINPVICQYKDGSKLQGQPWLHQLSLAEIKQFDCGAKRNPKFPKQQLIPGTEIPTLAEVFALVVNSSHPNAKTVGFNIETKSDPRKPHAQPRPKRFVELILKEVQRFGLQERVVLQSFDHRTLRAAKRQLPSLRLSALFRRKPKDWVTATLAAKADIVSPRHNLISKKAVAQCQQAGLKVIPWTANTQFEWQQLMDKNVDGIISDDPAPLLEFLGRVKPTN